MSGGWTWCSARNCPRTADVKIEHVRAGRVIGEHVACIQHTSGAIERVPWAAYIMRPVHADSRSRASDRTLNTEAGKMEITIEMVAMVKPDLVTALTGAAELDATDGHGRSGRRYAHELASVVDLPAGCDVLTAVLICNLALRELQAAGEVNVNGLGWAIGKGW